MLKQYGKLYLVPNYLSPDNEPDFLALSVRRSVHHIRHFIVESEKAARALIKRLEIATPQPELELWLLNEHSKADELFRLLEALEGEDAAIISDAGLPCVADPGADLVALAQQKNIEVIPLPGASSIFMALMASGMNGQQFAFNGYLPLDKVQRAKRIKELEADALRKKQTQIFMEAPYRNNQLLEEVLKNCVPSTRLCIACHISSAESSIKTKTIAEWSKHKPDLHKNP